MSELVAPLQRFFGFGAFRPGQERVVEAAVAGRDTLAVMPTGSGKSLTYQLAAMLRPRPTLVLSPLIALMKDQLDKLPPEIAPRATFVNSSLDPADAAERVRAVASGRIRLLYAAPERLRQRVFVEALRAAGIGLLVVDEVHCVSMWGHDFRPDYFFIRRVLDELGAPPVLGMTATATPETAREVATALGRTPEVVRTSVVRPNLRYDVDRVESAEDRRRALLTRVRAAAGEPAIVYARSRQSCEELAGLLRSHGLPAIHYHAGMEPEARTAAQEAFIEGRVPTVVATTAFGMGIDKPDVRLVLLYNYPQSLESYVQMVGRAGRDGEASETVLFAGETDARALVRFARADVPPLESLVTVLRALHERSEWTAAALTETADLDHDPRVLVGLLEQTGLVRRGFDAGRAMQVEALEQPVDAARRLEEVVDRLEAAALARARRLVEFAETERCRHRAVAEHFGERLDEACGMCDVCSSSSASGVRPFHDMDAPALPDDIGAAIVATVRSLDWPLGRKGLGALLAGSVAAPPSARRSRFFGILAAARPADVKRWVGLLEQAGALEAYETDDGYRLLRATSVVPPRIVAHGGIRDGPRDGAADGLFEQLRAWRRDRAASDNVPAYVVLHDSTLRELAAARPSSPGDLAVVKGFGPAKLERYGADVLAVIGATPG